MKYLRLMSLVSCASPDFGADPDLPLFLGSAAFTWSWLQEASAPLGLHWHMLWGSRMHLVLDMLNGSGAI